MVVMILVVLIGKQLTHTQNILILKSCFLARNNSYGYIHPYEDQCD